MGASRTPRPRNAVDERLTSPYAIDATSKNKEYYRQFLDGISMGFMALRGLPSERTKAGAPILPHTP